MKTIIIPTLTIIILLSGVKLFGQTAIPKDKESFTKPGMILTNGAGGYGSGGSENQSVQAGLKNYIDMQTGAAVYSIPLATVSGYQLSLPVSLNYYSNGIKVDQGSLPVGLGWNLSAGGVIVRFLKGLPDESENGFLGQDISGFDILDEDQKKNFIDDVLDKKKDSQADIFRIALPGINLYFSFDNVGNIITYPKQNISIEYAKGGTGRIVQFIITANDGIKYVFGDFSEKSIEQTKNRLLSVPLITNDKTDRLQYYYEYNELPTTEEVYDGFCDCFKTIEIPGDRYVKKSYAAAENEYWDDYSGPSSRPDTYAYSYVISDFGSQNIVDFYDGIDAPEIDYENIKEEVLEFYNSSWYLTKIIHPSGEEMVLSYERGPSIKTAQTPVVTKTFLESSNNSVFENEYIFADDPHYAIEGDVFPFFTDESLIISPSIFFNEYQYSTPDFTDVMTITGESYNDLVSPKFSNRLLYFPSSSNYSLRIEEKKTPYIKEIASSNGAKISFLYEDLDDHFKALRNIRQYKKGEFLNEYTLDNQVVDTDLSYSDEIDRYNMIEALIAQDLDLSDQAAMSVSHLNETTLTWQNELLKEYVMEGIKPYNYKRLVFDKLVSKNENSSSILYEFEYNQPEKLPRKTTLMKDVQGYPVTESKIVNHLSSLVVTNNGKIIKTIEPTEAAMETSYNPQLGILKKIKNMAGGYITLEFVKSYGARLQFIKQYGGGLGEETPISINVNYLNSFYMPIKPVREYNYSFYSIDKHKDENYYLKGVVRSSEYINDLRWFEKDLVLASSCEISYLGNGKEKFVFTTTDDIDGLDFNNKVYFIGGELFKDQYNVESGEFEVENTEFELVDYSEYPFSNIKSVGYMTGNIKEHWVFREDLTDPLIKEIYNYSYKTDPADILKSKSIIANKMLRGYEYKTGCDQWGIADVWCWNPNPKKYIGPASEKYRGGEYYLSSVSYHLASIDKAETDLVSNEVITSRSESKINETTLMNRRTVNDVPNDEGTLQTVTLYADDFDDTSGFIGALKTKNLKTSPIEKVSFRVDNVGNTFIVGAQHFVYDTSNPLQIKEQYHLEIETPLKLADFRFANGFTSGVVPLDEHIGPYLRYENYVLDNTTIKYDELNRTYATKGEDEMWSGTIIDIYSNSPVAEISNQELMLTEATPEPIVASEYISDENIENTQSVVLPINKAQEISILLDINSPASTNFYYKLIVDGILRSDGDFTAGNEYTIDLNPGVHTIEFYTKKYQEDLNNYQKDMTINYIEMQYNAFFSSFEEKGVESGNARTGYKYYNGSFSVPVSLDEPSEYVISYWYYDGNDWQFSGEIPFQATVNAGAPIDDLKVYKKGALMKGYVYDKKGLLIAEIDANQNRVLNEYDELNRLKIVRNTDKDIVKKYEYQIIHQQ
jgi:hypothetical protein